MFLLRNTTRNFPDKYQGKEFPSQPNSITLPSSPRSGAARAALGTQKTHRRGQK